MRKKGMRFSLGVGFLVVAGLFFVWEGSGLPLQSGGMNPCSSYSEEREEMDSLIEQGETLWKDSSLSTNGLACNSCHAHGANLNTTVPFPHNVEMHNRIVTLDQMINICMTIPMSAEPLGWADSRLTALNAYYTYALEQRAMPGEEESANPCGGMPGSHAGWTDQVTLLPAKDGATLSGNLSHGARIDLDWADNSSIACWPGTENENFSGSHVFYSLEVPQEAHSTLTVAVQPEAGVDVSVYAYQIGIESHDIPPSIFRAVSCEAGYDYKTDSNPGQSEETPALVAIRNSYNVLIGVAGANGEVNGAFTITLHYETKD